MTDENRRVDVPSWLDERDALALHDRLLALDGGPRRSARCWPAAILSSATAPTRVLQRWRRLECTSASGSEDRAKRGVEVFVFKRVACGLEPRGAHSLA